MKTQSEGENRSDDQFVDAEDEKATKKPNRSASPSEILGLVTGLMFQSPTHKHLFLADLEWLVMPAISLKQFRLIRNGDDVLGYVSWAYLSEEVEQRLLSGNSRLAPGDWRSGENIWLIDVVARGGQKKKMMDHLGPEIFKGKTVKTLRPRQDGKGLEAVEMF